MLKKEVLKALIDVDSNAEELAISIGVSKTSLYRFLNGQIKDYQKYVKPLHQFFADRGLQKDFLPEIWATTKVVYLDDLNDSQLSALHIEAI